ncbi:MAG: hypothetical protein KF809_15060 [Chloroflexi bacterium]|nr:hypothetical protein [Chloroflexota bacterium]
MIDIRGRAEEGRRSIEALWQALAADDDAAVEGLFLRTSIDKVPSVGGPAETVRTAFGLTREQCASMGTSSRARVIEDGFIAYFSTVQWRTTLYDEPTLVHGWMNAVWWDDAGRPWVWGTPSDEELATAVNVFLDDDLGPGARA